MKGALAGVGAEESGDSGAGLADGDEGVVVGFGEGLVGHDPGHGPGRVDGADLEEAEEAFSKLAVVAGGGVADGGAVLREPGLETAGTAADPSGGGVDASGVERRGDGQEHGADFEGLRQRFSALGLEAGCDLSGRGESGGGHLLRHVTHFGAFDAAFDERLGEGDGKGSDDESREDEPFGNGVKEVASAQLLHLREVVANRSSVEMGWAWVVFAYHGKPPRNIIEHEQSFCKQIFENSLNLP